MTTMMDGLQITSASRGRTSLLLAAVFFAVALGTWFRFTALDRKYFWFDEGHSAACVSGRPVQAIDEMFDGRPRRLSDLQEFLHLRPGESARTTITALVEGNPENAPVYFLLLRAWAELVGDSSAQLRSLSALVSILCLPLLFWFCLELFDSYWAAFAAAAWWSLSPFFVLYAQEARTYALFALLTILSGVLLARAVRIRSPGGWILYGTAALLGLYTHMFFGTLLIAHAVYVVTYGLYEVSGVERRNLFVGFFGAVLAAIGLFLPWFCVFLTHARHAALSEFLSKRALPHELVLAWIDNVGIVLVDFGLVDFVGDRTAAIAIAAVVVLLIGWSLRFLVQSTPRRTWMLVLSTSLIPPLLFGVSDLLFGNTRSQVARYWLPAYVGMGLSVSYLIGTKLAQRSAPAVGLAALLVATGAVSCFRSAQCTTWWNKGGIVGAINFFIREDIALRNGLVDIASARQPLLIVEYDHLKSFELLPMSALADPKIDWMGIRDPEKVEIPADRDVFIYRSPALVAYWRRQGKTLTVLECSGRFVRLEKDDVRPKQIISVDGTR